MILLDTDILSLLQWAEGTAYSSLMTRLSQAATEKVFACIVNFEEQTRGWLAFISKAGTIDKQIRAYAKLHTMLTDFSQRDVLPFNELAAVQYAQLRKLNVRIGAMDLKIAAIALANNALLLSRNLRDFRKVPGLKVEDWTA